MSTQGRLTSYVLGEAYIQSGKTLTRTYRWYLSHTEDPTNGASQEQTLQMSGWPNLVDPGAAVHLSGGNPSTLVQRQITANINYYLSPQTSHTNLSPTSNTVAALRFPTSKVTIFWLSRRPFCKLLILANLGPGVTSGVFVLVLVTCQLADRRMNQRTQVKAALISTETHEGSILQDVSKKKVWSFLFPFSASQASSNKDDIAAHSVSCWRTNEKYLYW